MSTRTRYQPDPNEDRKVVYNPMTGGRRDLEVEKEDGASADKTHKRWKAARIKHLEALLANPDLSAWSRAIYERELGNVKG